MLRRLGVNLLYLVPRQVGGTEIYARRLVAALARELPEVVVFCGAEAAAELPDPEWPANVRVVRAPVKAAIKPLRLLFELLWLPVAARRAGVELLHSLGTTAPLWGRAVRVTTVHDLIYDSGKVDVVPLGLGMRDVPDPALEAELRARLERPVLLIVDAALPHKHLDRLLRARWRWPAIPRYGQSAGRGTARACSSATTSATSASSSARCTARCCRDRGSAHRHRPRRRGRGATGRRDRLERVGPALLRAPRDAVGRGRIRAPST